MKKNRDNLKNRYIKREIEASVEQFLVDPEILVLRGPRQAGKTTLIKNIASKLPQKNVFYFTFEDELVKNKFETNPQEFIKFYATDSTQKYFFLLDEVQYLAQAGKQLKLIFDLFPQVKLIVTGSSTLDLNKLGEYLVGRAIYFEVMPFSFGEFLQTKNQKLLIEYQKKRFDFNHPQLTHSIFIDQLNKSLREYLTYGGYPRVVLETDLQKKQILLKNIFSTYVEKDIIQLFGLKHRQHLIAVLKHLGINLGQLLHYESLGNAVNLNYYQVREMLAILQQTYLIQSLRPFHRNQTTELKKNPKLYFIDLGMRNALLDKFEFDDQEYGFLLENFILNRFRDQKVKFWRTTARAEVDFVLTQETIPIEVKTRAKITRSLRSFVDTYQPKLGVITDLTDSREELIDQTEIFITPVALV